MTNPSGWTSGSAETIKALTDDEVTRFFKAIDSQEDSPAKRRDRCLFTLMLSMGLRCAEVSLIQVNEHLRIREYPERSEIFVTRVKRKRDPKTGEPKPRLGRWFKLSDQNRRVLLEWLKARKKLKHATHSESLFITSQTGTISPMYIFNLTKKYAALAGLPHLHPHQFRHTCGARLARQGRSAFEIKERLGHTSVLSSEVYVRLAGPDRLAADIRADEAIEGGGEDD